MPGFPLRTVRETCSRWALGVLATWALGLVACGTNNSSGVGPTPARADAGLGPGFNDAAVDVGLPVPSVDAGVPDVSVSPPAPAPPAPPAPPTPPAVPPAMPGKPIPARLVVFGDSIATCATAGDKNAATCSLKKLHAHLAAGGAGASLSYENLAVNGAETADVPERQLPRVAARPGHALVVIYVGGNDLRPFMMAPDAVAEAGFNRIVPQIEAAWTRIQTALGDRTMFPDGVTLVMNNQYDPFDACTAPPFFISATKLRLLRAFNERLANIARAAGATLTDQFTPFLGHGHHFAVRSCPHYQPGATAFMADLIHPNAAGHEQLYQQWKRVVDGFYPR